MAVLQEERLFVKYRASTGANEPLPRSIPRIDRPVGEVPPQGVAQLGEAVPVRLHVGGLLYGGRSCGGSVCDFCFRCFGCFRCLCRFRRLAGYRLCGGHGFGGGGGGFFRG